MPFPLDVRFIRESEAKLGRALPPGYAARMRRANGGEVRVGHDVFNLHPILDPSDRKRLARTCNDIVRETVKARERAGFLPDALAVGDNGCGDKLVFLPQEGAARFADAVYWWDHETGRLHKVADDFDELPSVP